MYNGTAKVIDLALPRNDDRRRGVEELGTF